MAPCSNRGRLPGQDGPPANLVRGNYANTQLDCEEAGSPCANDAVMAVLFLFFGVDLIAKGIPPLT